MWPVNIAPISEVKDPRDIIGHVVSAADWLNKRSKPLGVFLVFLGGVCFMIERILGQ